MEPFLFAMPAIFTVLSLLFSSESRSKCFPVPPIPLVVAKVLLVDLPSRSCPQVERVPSWQSCRKPAIPATSYHTKVTSCHIPGQQPRRGPLLKLPNHLGEYPVPNELREAVEEGGEKEVVSMEPALEEVCVFSHTTVHTCEPPSSLNAVHCR